MFCLFIKSLLAVCVFLCVFVAPVCAELTDFIELDKPLELSLTSNQLTMNDAIKLALINNPKVTLEESLLQEEKWKAKEFRGYLLPQVFFDQGFVATNRPVEVLVAVLNQRNLPSNLNMNYPGTRANFYTRIGLNVSLLNRPLLNKLKLSKLEVEYRKQVGKKELLNLVYNVRKAYINVLMAKNRVASSKEALKIVNQDFMRNKDLLENGKISKGDFLNVSAKKLSLENSNKKQLQALDIAFMVLGGLIGDEKVKNYDLVDEILVDSRLNDIDKLMEYSIIHNPDILSGEVEIKKKKQELKIAKNTGSLTINGFADWGVDTIFDDQKIGKSFFVGVTMHKSLFDSGIRRYRIKQANEKFLRQNIELNDLNSLVKFEVIQKYYDFINAKEKIEIANAFLEAANTNIQSGKISAESDLFNAQKYKQDAIYDFNIALIELQKAIGMSLTDIMSGKNLNISEDD